MELLIVRHGIAEVREDFAKKNLGDHLRPLTLKGRKKIQKVGMQICSWMPTVDLIISSPFVRARQTAEILAQIYFGTTVVEAPELVPQSPPTAFLKWLKAHARDHNRVVVVGHEPQLSCFASFLLSGKSDSFIDIKKGGALCLELESFDISQAGTAELLWLLPPKFIKD